MTLTIVRSVADGCEEFAPHHAPLVVFSARRLASMHAKFVEHLKRKPFGISAISIRNHAFDAIARRDGIHHAAVGRIALAFEAVKLVHIKIFRA